MTPSLDAYLEEPGGLEELSDDELKKLLADVVTAQEEDRRECNILYYTPVSKRAAEIHESTAQLLGVGGGNRSGKTETVAVEVMALSTGIIPLCLRDQLMPKFRGPVHVRVDLESLTTVLHPIWLPKLQWWKWTGIDEPGGERGHWGWLPKMCLKNGDWDKAWSEKLRTLTIQCRDPEQPQRILGESLWQFMSYDQDASDHASGTFHHVIHDEPPPRDIWLENRSRTLDVNGRTYLAMTWPKDPAIPVDWIYDEVYEPGSPGPMKDPDTDWFELHTTDNQHLDQKAVLERSAKWSQEERAVAIFGQPIRFSNLIHPLFTDTVKTWCFRCVKPVFAVEKLCVECGSEDIENYCHVGNFEHSLSWPCIFLLDPHPRKPHMMAWIQVDPQDDLLMVAEAECDDEPSEVKKTIDEIEESYHLQTTMRVMDPNMGRSPASAQRDVTWQDEFANVGLDLDLADSSDVGRSRVNEYLKPDHATHRPRLLIHERCRNATQQIKRFAWGEFRKAIDRDLKQTPRDKYDDYPALLRYCLNLDPVFSTLYHGAPVLKRPGTRRGAY